MSRRRFSFRFKFFAILCILFLTLLSSVVYLFINIKKDRVYDKQIEFFSTHAQTINHFRANLSSWYGVIYEYTADKNLKSLERYLRLNNIINYQFQNLVSDLTIDPTIKKVLMDQHKQFMKAKEYGDRIFDAKTEGQMREQLYRLKLIEESMVQEVEKLSNKTSLEISRIFEQRSQNYEHLLIYFMVLLGLYIVIGFSLLLQFFTKNVTKPLSEFLRVINLLDSGVFNTKVEISANAEFDKLAVAFNDMIDRLGTLTISLQEKNDRLETILNTPAVGVVIIDSEHKLLYINKWASARFGKKNTITYLKSKSQAEGIMMKRLQDVRFETYVFEDRDEKGNEYECFMNPLGKEMLLMIFDVTEKNKLEENLRHYIENVESIVAEKTGELQEAYATLEQKNTELTHLDDLKNQFLQNISHELRTPLTSIIGYLDVVLNYHNIPPTQRTFLQIALENSLSLLKIINDLLNLTDLESGRYKINLEPKDIRKVVKTVIKQIEIQANQKNLKINFKADKKTDEKLFELVVDESKISSVFNNLLDNAIKFTHQGKIDVSIAATKKSVSIKIKDSGIGISKEDIKSIFDKFSQVDNSISKPYDGAGLGLVIAKRIVELHHGELKVVSDLGKGTTFTIILPRQQ